MLNKHFFSSLLLVLIIILWFRTFFCIITFYSCEMVKKDALMTVHILSLFAIIHTHVMMNNTILWLTSKLTLSPWSWGRNRNKKKKVLISLGSKNNMQSFNFLYVFFFAKDLTVFTGRFWRWWRKVHQHLFVDFFLCANFFVFFLSSPFDVQFDEIENWRIFSIYYLSLFDLTNSYDEFCVKNELIFFCFTCLNGIIFNYWWLLLFCLIWFDFLLFFLSIIHIWTDFWFFLRKPLNWNFNLFSHHWILTQVAVKNFRINTIRGSQFSLIHVKKILMPKMIFSPKNFSIIF